MAKTPNRPATAKQTKLGGKPSAAKKPKPAAKRSKKETQAGVDAEHEAYYQANKVRIDEALGQCIKHFGDKEPGIVRAVGRKLLDHYTMHRMKAPKAGSGGVV